MSILGDINKKARAMGLTYGEYVASHPSTKPTTTISQPPIKRPRHQKYSDYTAFALWQNGNTDAQIASKLGVSRAMIQRWRDKFELPSVKQADTSRYHLVETQYGRFVVYE